jgi:hypothetical protein
MTEGITLICEGDDFLFAIGEYTNSSNIKDSICYIVSSTLKYREGIF